MTPRQRKGDFAPKYYNDVEIDNDKALLPSERVRELVKHYAMQLFGLATDMATAEQELIDGKAYIDLLVNDNNELRAKIDRLTTRHCENESELVKELRKQLAEKPKRIKLTPAERIAVKADYYEKRIQQLIATFTYYKSKCKRLEQELERLKRSNDNG